MYVSEVSVMVECRSVSFTAWMSPPPPCVSVAATWRRSRRVMGGRSVVARMRRKLSETVPGCSQEPSSLVKTLPVSCQASAHCARSFAWRALWSRSSVMVVLSSAIVLALPSVLGSDS